MPNLAHDALSVVNVFSPRAIEQVGMHLQTHAVTLNAHMHKCQLCQISGALEESCAVSIFLLQICPATEVGERSSQIVLAVADKVS